MAAITAEAAKPVAGDGVVRVNLAQALKLGLAHDRDVRSSAYDAASARASVTQAWSVYHPQVSFDASARLFDSARTGITSGAGAAATNSYDVSLTVTQLLFDLGQGLFDVYRSRELAKVASFNEFTTALSAAQRIYGDFYDVLRTGALETLQREVLAQATRQRQQATALFESGKGSRLDVTRSTVAESNSKVDLEVTANASREALARLRRDLGLAPATPLEVNEATVVPTVDVELVKALGLGEKRPTVLAAEAQTKAQRHALDSARIARWASFQVTGSYDYYLKSSRDVSSEYVLGASVSVPLWDGQSGKSAETRAKLSWLRAGEQLLKEREQVRLDIEQAHLSNRDATDRLTSAERASGLAAESLLQTEESYRLGSASLLDVGDARTEYQRAESNRITARLDRDLAALNLMVAVGRLPLTDAALAATTGDVAKETGR
ncbi:MAG: TolC family protein [Armatimonadetes bacterium]|nr:TolC family protein [Armatimonadota bacterium]